MTSEAGMGLDYWQSSLAEDGRLSILRYGLVRPFMRSPWSENMYIYSFNGANPFDSLSVALTWFLISSMDHAYVPRPGVQARS